MRFAFVFFLEVDNRDQKINPTPHPQKNPHDILYHRCRQSREVKQACGMETYIVSGRGGVGEAIYQRHYIRIQNEHCGGEGCGSLIITRFHGKQQSSDCDPTP